MKLRVRGKREMHPDVISEMKSRHLGRTQKHVTR